MRMRIWARKILRMEERKERMRMEENFNDDERKEMERFRKKREKAEDKEVNDWDRKRKVAIVWA